MNKALLIYELGAIKAQEVKEQVDRGLNLMYVLEKIIDRKFKVDIGALLPKKTLATMILQPRFDEVEQEYLGGRWKPKLPFERFLRESVFSKIQIYK